MLHVKDITGAGKCYFPAFSGNYDKPTVRTINLPKDQLTNQPINEQT